MRRGVYIAAAVVVFFFCLKGRGQTSRTLGRYSRLSTRNIGLMAYTFWPRLRDRLADEPGNDFANGDCPFVPRGLLPTRRAAPVAVTPFPATGASYFHGHLCDCCEGDAWSTAYPAFHADPNATEAK